jgi:hypothetical protein
LSFITESQALAALEALGFQRDPADTEKHGLPFHVGALLATAEAAAWQDINRMDLAELHEGYLLMLMHLTGQNPRETARAWVLLIQDRLNRTGIELNEATEGEGRMFVEVAGPAMFVASNLMNVLNNTEVSGDTMRATIRQVETELKKARWAWPSTEPRTSVPTTHV